MKLKPDFETMPEAKIVPGGKPRERVETDLKLPIPQPTQRQLVRRLEWAGLNRRYKLDTGMLSEERGICTDHAPYLYPAPGGEKAASYDGYPCCLYGFGQYFIVIYRKGAKIKLTYTNLSDEEYIGDLQEEISEDVDYTVPRSVVKFNVYDQPDEPVSGEFIEVFLIFPDMKSFSLKRFTNKVSPFHPTGNKNATWFNTHNNKFYHYTDRWVETTDLPLRELPTKTLAAFPKIKHACVNNSRLFGIDDDRIYVSSFNDYSNWTLDTADEYNPNNAWCSPTGANTRANGKLVAVTSFQNHVVCFKQDYMHEILNNKNPFRIWDIYAEGTIDSRTVCEVGGRLIFTDRDDVKVYQTVPRTTFEHKKTASKI